MSADSNSFPEKFEEKIIWRSLNTSFGGQRRLNKMKGMWTLSPGHQCGDDENQHILLFLQKKKRPLDFRFVCWHYQKKKKKKVSIYFHSISLHCSSLGFALPLSLTSMTAGFSASAPLTVTVALGVPRFSSVFEGWSCSALFLALSCWTAGLL